MSEAAVSMLWMLARPELDWVEVGEGMRATVDTPDDGRASLTLELTAAAAASLGALPELGSRTRVGVMFGILAHTLFDGHISAREVADDGSVVLQATDLLAELDEKHTSAEGTLLQQVRAVLAAWEVPLRVDELLIDESLPGIEREPGESDGAWLTRACAASGLSILRQQGTLQLSNRLRIGPLAMERTAMPAIRPADCTQERRFSPVAGVRVAEIDLPATTRLRGLVRGVMALEGFGADDGAYYTQHIVHRLQAQTYDQSLTLVRLGAA